VSLCAVPDCASASPRLTRGMCNRHYKRWTKFGDPLGTARRTPEERFWARVDKRNDSECWLWTGGFMGTGYGGFFLNGRMTVAHRVAYELLVGPIPDGLHIDHLCRVRACVKPDHLEPVTLAENNRRAGSAVTSCRRAGHPYTPQNTYYAPNGTRRCRECERERNRKRRFRASEAA
jgi:hypothetical protein